MGTSSASKAKQLAALAQVLPGDVAVGQMLEWWKEFDASVWGGRLRPCWLTSAIEPYGHCLGHYERNARTISLAPLLWERGSHAVRRAIMVHEMAHQAQQELYRPLDAAKGPRSWTDTSHRCPSWSRAVEDWIQAEGLDVFCPVWHRSTGNAWHPWVPDSDDWMVWRKADPGERFDGRRLLSFVDAKHGPTAMLLNEMAAAFYSGDADSIKV